MRFGQKGGRSEKRGQGALVADQIQEGSTDRTSVLNWPTQLHGKPEEIASTDVPHSINRDH